MPLLSFGTISVLLLWRRRLQGVPPVWTYLWIVALVTLLRLAGGLALQLALS